MARCVPEAVPRRAGASASSAEARMALSEPHILGRAYRYAGLNLPEARESSPRGRAGLPLRLIAT